MEVLKRMVNCTCSVLIIMVAHDEQRTCRGRNSKRHVVGIKMMQWLSLGDCLARDSEIDCRSQVSHNVARCLINNRDAIRDGKLRNKATIFRRSYRRVDMY